MSYNNYAYIDKKNVTFSGTDTLAFIVLPDTAPIVLGSLTTFSYSSYRAKKPVATLGSILSAGTAKGGRIIAGTLIFTIINQSWVNEIVDVVPWLRNKCEGVVYSDELPLFDIIIISANEYGKHVNMKILGVNITDEAGVLSVNDAYSENTFSFIAREIRIFNDKKNITKEDMTYKSNKYFSNFTVSSFNGSTFYPKQWNRYTRDKDVFDRVKNSITRLDKESFDKMCNNLVNLGYKYDDMTNNNVKIQEDIVIVMNNIYGANNIDPLFFINNVLPYIDAEFSENNNEYHVANSIYKSSESFYSSISLGYEIFSKLSYDSDNSSVYVFSRMINDSGTKVFFTNNGYIEEDKLVSSDKYKESRPVGSTDSPGVTNMYIEVFIGNFIVDSVDKSIKYYKSYYEFLEEFIVRITPTSDEPVRCISNIYIGDNNVNTFIMSGTTDVSFKSELERLNSKKPKKIKLIIKEIEYNNFFTIDVEFIDVKPIEGSVV